MRSHLAVLGVVMALLSGHAAGEPSQEGAETASASRPTAVITGANRGLGLELARQLSAAGYEVIGTARRPDAAEELRSLGARIVQLDVADPASVERFAAEVGEGRVDLLINNAGIGNRVSRLEEVDLDDAERVLQVNYLGPMRVTQALLPALHRGERKLVVNITSGLGSVGNNTRGGYYGYRESKAALNMFTRSLAAELRPEGFTCIVMSPGWVRTDMGGPNAPLSPEQSVRGIVSVIEGLTPADSGHFFNHDGQELPW